MNIATKSVETKKQTMSRDEAEKIMWAEIKKGEESGIKHGWIPHGEVWKKLGV